ncbi:prespore-specific protein [Heterostelium album PN500]|uniref:Prespore-specific protein n=1 Tax=Heterostelium pallidum (strain ATCC 26659 / Pp 5 / PN500) TaxID=670386 RepID=D3BU15_HETP5|nr:prespore-specific protein [Heterostelium album PN500]EFA75201.1 prespore-specific protein [Heterostelium album PN500]|eukprot:XP_020427335.1 prespore-specific protein [Heterostelium album PN500]
MGEILKRYIFVGWLDMKDHKSKSSKSKSFQANKDTYCDFNSARNKWVMRPPVHPIPPFNQRVHPLAILIGWINAQPQALEKYTTLYNNAGFFTISIIPPILGHPYPRYFSDLARDFLDYLLVEMNQQPRSIIIQVFSGNIVFLSHIQYVLKDKKYSSLLPLIKGEILDSSPSELTVHGGKKSMAAPFPDTWFYRKLISTAFTFLTFLVDISEINKDFWFRFKVSAIKDKPKLYIYSLDDPVTPYLHVKKAMNLNRHDSSTVIGVDSSKVVVASANKNVEDGENDKENQCYATQMRNYFIKEASKLKETPINSVDMKRYMRHKFEFIGLKQPARKTILKNFLSDHGRPKEEDLLSIYKLPEREFTYCAIELAEPDAKKKEKAPPSRLAMYLEFGLHQPWWDTIDIISTKLVGQHFQLYPDLIGVSIDKWLAQESIWIKRIAILFQLKYKKQTDTELLFKCIDSTYLKHADEFFIQKAIGWSLREYAKTDKKTVKNFIENRPNLSNLTMQRIIKDKLNNNNNINSVKKIDKNESSSNDKNTLIKKKDQVITTCCKQINSVTYEWSIALPSHPIPPFDLKAHPLTILIGWIGAQPKNLERYSKIYRENGFCTLSFIPPISGHFFPKKMKKISISLSEYLLEQINSTPRSIIIQVFSVKGQIFDSCPAEISEKAAYTSLVVPYPKAKLYKRVVGMTCKLYSTVIDVPKLNMLFWYRLSNCPISAPQMYFYSLDDPITSYLDVEKGIEVMRKQKITVTAVQFDQSKHCNHLGSHPMQYLKGLYKFWQSSLKPRDLSSSLTNKPSNYQNILSSLGLKMLWFFIFCFVILPISVSYLFFNVNLEEKESTFWIYQKDVKQIRVLIKHKYKNNYNNEWLKNKIIDYIGITRIPSLEVHLSPCDENGLQNRPTLNPIDPFQLHSGSRLFLEICDKDCSSSTTNPSSSPRFSNLEDYNDKFRTLVIEKTPGGAKEFTSITEWNSPHTLYLPKNPNLGIDLLLTPGCLFHIVSTNKVGSSKSIPSETIQQYINQLQKIHFHHRNSEPLKIYLISVVPEDTPEYTKHLEYQDLTTMSSQEDFERNNGISQWK